MKENKLFDYNGYDWNPRTSYIENEDLFRKILSEESDKELLMEFHTFFDRLMENVMDENVGFAYKCVEDEVLKRMKRA